MIAAKDSIGPRSSDQLPNSRKIFTGGRIYPDLRVPCREISLAPTNGVDGSVRQNESVRVYDTSGPWGDPAARCDVRTGLPALRSPWILARGDVQGTRGARFLPQDNGYLSRGHEELAVGRAPDSRGRLETFPGLSRQTLRASQGHPVTQLWYARQGIITPEMEYIAIRENLGREAAYEAVENKRGRAQCLQPAASRPVVWRGDPEAHHAGVRAPGGRAAAGPSSRPTSTTRSLNR